MRYALFLFGIVCMVASGAGAQANFSSYALASSPLSGTIAAPAPNAQNFFMPAIFADPALLPPSPAPEPQGIQGVFENYSWQAYAVTPSCGSTRCPALRKIRTDSTL